MNRRIISRRIVTQSDVDREIAARRKQGLKIEVVDGQLSITVGIDCLAHAIQCADSWDGWGLGKPSTMYRITDNHLFANELRDVLDRDSDCIGGIQHLLDKAAQEVQEHGGESVEEVLSHEWESEQRKRMKVLP